MTRPFVSYARPNLSCNGVLTSKSSDIPSSHFRHLPKLKEPFFISERESGLSPKSGLFQALALLPGLSNNPSLEEIVLAVDINLETGQDIADFRNLSEWGALDRALDIASPSIPTFRRLFVLVEITAMFWGTPNEEEFSKEDYCEMVANIVRETMPQLLARGLLVVRAEEVSCPRYS